MKYGLNEDTLRRIENVFRAHPAVRRVRVFGSRAMHTHRPGSDIDLVIDGDGLTLDELLTIQIQLDELGFLYQFDVQDWRRIRNTDLREHIQRVGDTIYEATE